MVFTFTPAYAYHKLCPFYNLGISILKLLFFFIMDTYNAIKMNRPGEWIPRPNKKNKTTKQKQTKSPTLMTKKGVFITNRVFV